MISIFVWTVRDIFELIGTGLSILVLVIFVVWVGLNKWLDKREQKKRKKAKERENE